MGTQLAMFGGSHPKHVGPTRARSRQRKEAERVSVRIAEAIKSFCRARERSRHTTFHADELRAWVREKVGEVAPDSPGRVLRQLRQQGVIDYEITNRAASEYHLLIKGARR